MTSRLHGGGGSTLTLDQALALAEQHHPQMRASAAQVDAARAAIVTAKAYPNPEAALTAGRQTYRVPGNVSGLSLQTG